MPQLPWTRRSRSTLPQRAVAQAATHANDADRRAEVTLAPFPRDASVEGLPTYVMPTVVRPKRRRGGPLGWMRTLRGRLVLSYMGLLIVLLLALGVVLNSLITRTLYAQELERVASDASSALVVNQRDFDLAVRGHLPNCDDAQSYQQAFSNTVAAHMIALHAGIQSVTLLDTSGNVLAPQDAVTHFSAAGTLAQDAHLAALQTRILRAGPRLALPGGPTIAPVAYDTTNAAGERVGVVLLVERYRTVSICLRSNYGTVGLVRVVTTFPRVAQISSALKALLILSIAAVIVVGTLIGGPLTAQALRPLTRMTQVARRIASGDLSQRVRLPHSGDEIGQLADTFDEMVARIELAFAAQQASEERMRQFIADASHELRTPLTSIRGYTDVLLRGAKDDPATAQQVLLATQREAERMSRLVTDLLTLARLDAGRPADLRPLDIIALAGEAVDQARLLAGEREVALRSDGAGRLLVSGDADRLKQVLLILLDNALKYGRATSDGWVRVQVGRTERSAYVTVSDNGEGIRPDDVPHIFDRFYRAQRAAQRRLTDPQSTSSSPVYLPADAPERPLMGAPSGPRRTPQREGTGLGLSIAQAIARAHNGSLTVQSDLGFGTTFTLELPLPQPRA